MSRIGRLPVAIPAGVEVTVADGNVVTVKGPKGTLERALPTELEIKVEDGADQRRKTAYRRKTAESRVCVGYRICGNSVRTGPSGKR